MLSIFGGVLRGLKLKFSKQLTRPTQALLKRRVFDYKQNFTGISFIDLCAGSGAIGFEAWSRGAEELYLIEKERASFQIVEDNYKKIKARSDDLVIKKRPIYLSNKDAEHWMKSFKRDYISWDEDRKRDTIIFFDPPYSKISIYKSIFNEILDENWYKGVFWVESDVKVGLSYEFWEQNYSKYSMKFFKQGTSYIILINL